MLKHNLPVVCADWQSALAESIRSPAELCRLLGLDARLAAEAESAGSGLPLLAPRPYLARIQPGDPADPLLLQVLPRAAEQAAAPGYTPDPLNEAAALCGPGLLRKYQGRVLMVASNHCAVHCRYCFRRHFRCNGTVAPGRMPYAPPPVGGGGGDILKRSDWEVIAGLIATDKTIEEVILSGGDPLTLPDEELACLAERLGAIPHLHRLRVHTRLPVVIPQRVTAELIAWLRQGRLTPIMVVQINHPAEIDDQVTEALGRLIDAGIPVLNQSVLLRGVNDSADVLVDLCKRLVKMRVMPYYLHQLDPVLGAAHFETPIAVGVSLMAQLRARLPGYAVPRYVCERPGKTAKVALA